MAPSYLAQSWRSLAGVPLTCHHPYHQHHHHHHATTALSGPATRSAGRLASRRGQLPRPPHASYSSALPPRGQPSPPQQPGSSAASEPKDPLFLAGSSRPQKQQHVWNVGVDFGTYASGFGYSKVALDSSSSSSSSANCSELSQQQRDGVLSALGVQGRSDAPPAAIAPVKLHHNWPDQPLQDYKTRSVCLYRGSQLEAWGWTAWRRWSQMTDQQRKEGNYHFVEEFKLLLQGAGAGGGSGGGGATSTRHILPPGLTEVQVVADFLSELRGYIYKHLARSDPGSALEPASISWCLTVPAMWGEGAKAKMRQAANRAGMARASDPGSLMMVLEPEAAAAAAVMHQQQQQQLRSRKVTQDLLPSQAAASPAAPSDLDGVGSDCCDAAAADTAAKAAETSEMPPAAAAAASQKGDGSGAGGGWLAAIRSGVSGSSGTAATGAAGVTATAAATLRDGDVLLVLDCGGGTADITMHQVVGSGTAVRLQEAAAGRGVLAGGRHVDDGLWQHLRCAVVGPEVWDDWQRSCPAEWMQTATEWEASKSQLRGPVTLQLRPSLLDRMTASSSPSLSLSSSSSSGLRSDGSVVVSEEVLERKVYGPVVDQILAAANDVVDQGRRCGSTVTKILLAGGMANSPYVQQRVRQLAQARGVPLLMPRQPQALVVSGAVLFGQLPSLVTARRSRQTYGIDCRSPWTSDDAASAASFGYPAKLWKDEDREYVADGVFELYVKRNQLVQMDEVVRRIFCPTSRATTAVGIDLYATDAEDARYVMEPGMRKVASVKMELPAGWMSTVTQRQEYDIEVELRFGGTEITLFARDPRTNNAVATTIKWTPEQLM